MELQPDWRQVARGLMGARRRWLTALRRRDGREAASTVTVDASAMATATTTTTVPACDSLPPPAAVVVAAAREESPALAAEAAARAYLGDIAQLFGDDDAKAALLLAGHADPVLAKLPGDLARLQRQLLPCCGGGSGMVDGGSRGRGDGDCGGESNGGGGHCWHDTHRAALQTMLRCFLWLGTRGNDVAAASARQNILLVADGGARPDLVPGNKKKHQKHKGGDPCRSSGGGGGGSGGGGGGTSSMPASIFWRRAAEWGMEQLKALLCPAPRPPLRPADGVAAAAASAPLLRASAPPPPPPPPATRFGAAVARQMLHYVLPGVTNEAFAAAATASAGLLAVDSQLAAIDGCAARVRPRGGTGAHRSQHGGRGQCRALEACRRARVLPPGQFRELVQELLLRRRDGGGGGGGGVLCRTCGRVRLWTAVPLEAPEWRPCIAALEWVLPWDTSVAATKAPAPPAAAAAAAAAVAGLPGAVSGSGGGTHDNAAAAAAAAPAVTTAAAAAAGATTTTAPADRDPRLRSVFLQFDAFLVHAAVRAAAALRERPSTASAACGDLHPILDLVGRDGDGNGGGSGHGADGDRHTPPQLLRRRCRRTLMRTLQQLCCDAARGLHGGCGDDGNGQDGACGGAHCAAGGAGNDGGFRYFLRVWQGLVSSSSPSCAASPAVLSSGPRDVLAACARFNCRVAAATTASPRAGGGAAGAFPSWKGNGGDGGGGNDGGGVSDDIGGRIGGGGCRTGGGDGDAPPACKKAKKSRLPQNRDGHAGSIGVGPTPGRALWLAAQRDVLHVPRVVDAVAATVLRGGRGGSGGNDGNGGGAADAVDAADAATDAADAGVQLLAWVAAPNDGAGQLAFACRLFETLRLLRGVCLNGGPGTTAGEAQGPRREPGALAVGIGGTVGTAAGRRPQATGLGKGATPLPQRLARLAADRPMLFGRALGPLGPAVWFACVVVSQTALLLPPLPRAGDAAAGPPSPSSSSSHSAMRSPRRGAAAAAAAAAAGTVLEVLLDAVVTLPQAAFSRDDRVAMLWALRDHVAFLRHHTAAGASAASAAETRSSGAAREGAPASDEASEDTGAAVPTAAAAAAASAARAAQPGHGAQAWDAMDALCAAALRRFESRF